uniref:hypothetical protein n=1 Tax=Streptomyces parvus TaxID=66428 RepID=UPI003717E475
MLHSVFAAALHKASAWQKPNLAEQLWLGKAGFSERASLSCAMIDAKRLCRVRKSKNPPKRVFLTFPSPFERLPGHGRSS